MTLAIVNGRVFTMEGEPLPRGTVLVEGEKILAVGKNLIPPEGACVLEAGGKVVLPGLVEAHSHLGLIEEGLRFEGDDANENSEPVTPHLRALDGINPFDMGFQDALEGGVTCAYVGPGSANVIGGEGLVLKTSGRVVDKMVLRAPAGLKVAFGENPKWNHGYMQKKMPVTRMATAALLRQELARAEHYLRKIKKGEDVERDLKMEALSRVLEGEIPLRAHAHRADDLLTALRVAREFGVGLVLEHCTEGHLIAEELASSGVPCVVGPYLSSRSKVELRDLNLQTAAVLWRAGVQVALTTDHPVVPVRYLLLMASLACAAGMPEEEALRAVTINAARILGVEERLGSIRPGKDADMVIMSGDPLESRSKVETVVMAGRIVWQGGKANQS